MEKYECGTIRRKINRIHKQVIAIIRDGYNREMTGQKMDKQK